MSRTPPQPEISPSLPEKPALEGLEAKWMARWEADGVYRFDRTAERAEVYAIDTPPPTVSGSLHVGHVFSYTHTDILARYHRMRGRAVFYPMGWDDNGLPTERRVQNYFGVRCDPSLPYDPSFAPPETPGKHPISISRPNFIELCERLTVEDEKAFEALWRTLGLSVDWAMTYSTVGKASQRVSQRAFLRLLSRGTAYQLEAPTLWDVDFRTAVAQAELEDRETPGAYRPADRHRHDAARAAARLCRACRAPGRPAVPAAVRDRDRHAALQGPGASEGPPAGQSREGDRRGDDLHLRRHHRRHLVARADPSGARRDSARRPASPGGSPTMPPPRRPPTTVWRGRRPARRGRRSWSC
jgi:valyl-tRNA synthetase